MFNAVTINFDRSTHTLGNLIECLLFYDEVFLIVGMDELPILWSKFGINELEKLKDYGLSIFIAVNPVSCGNIPGFGEDIRTFTLVDYDMRQRVCDKAVGYFFGVEKLDAKQQQIANHYFDLSNSFRYSQNALNAVHEDIYSNFVHKKILQAQLEEIQYPLSMYDTKNKYEFRKVEKGFVFKTNILTGEIEERAKHLGYTDMYFRHQRLLMQMAMTYGIIEFAAEKSSTLCTSRSQSLIVSCKQESLL